jgi:hypothetical protein
MSLKASLLVISKLLIVSHLLTQRSETHILILSKVQASEVARAG